MSGIDNLSVAAENIHNLKTTLKVNGYFLIDYLKSKSTVNFKMFRVQSRVLTSKLTTFSSWNQNCLSVNFQNRCISFVTIFVSRHMSRAFSHTQGLVSQLWFDNQLVKT